MRKALPLLVAAGVLLGGLLYRAPIAVAACVLEWGFAACGALVLWGLACEVCASHFDAAPARRIRRRKPDA